MGLLLGCGTTPHPAAAQGGSGAPFQSFFGDDGSGSGGCPSVKSDAGTAVPDAGDPLCASQVPSVSFTCDVSRLVGCTGEACHSPWTYDSLVLRRSDVCCDHRLLVDPGHPSSSQLVQALLGISPCTARMPLYGEMPDSDIATVVAWVCQGAARN